MRCQTSGLKIADHNKEKRTYQSNPLQHHQEPQQRAYLTNLMCFRIVDVRTCSKPDSEAESQTQSDFDTVGTNKTQESIAHV